MKFTFLILCTLTLFVPHTAKAAINCIGYGGGVSIVGNYYEGEGAVGDTGTASGYHYAEIIFKDGTCSDNMYFSSPDLWTAVINAKSNGTSLKVKYCDGCTGGVSKTFNGVTVLALMAFADPGALSCHVSVKAGSATNLKRFLKSMDHCVIALEGTFILTNPILVSQKTDLTIEGQNATWATSSNFNFKIKDSREILIKNLSINDVPDSNFLFDFQHCRLSGLDNISYTSSTAIRIFAVFQNGTDHGSVKNCNIKKVHSGILFGIEASDSTEPFSQPITEPSASFCIAENNVISDFSTQAIATRASTNWKGVDPGLAFMRLGTIIRGNTITNPNVDRKLCASNNHGCFIGIEAWGGDVLVEGNSIMAEPNAGVNTGISLAYGFGITCRNNIIKGGYNYQGIELQEIDYSTITGNYIENVTSSTDLMTAGIGVSIDEIKLTSKARSVKNTLNKNRMVNCKRGILLDEAATVKTVIIEDTLMNCEVGIWTWGENFELKNSVFLSNGTGLYLGAGSAFGEPALINGNVFKNTALSVIWNDLDPTGLRGRPFIFSNNTVEGWGNTTYPEAVMFRCGPSSVINNTFKMDNRTGNPNPVIAVKRWNSYEGRYSYTVTGNGKGPGVGTTVPWWMGDMVPLTTTDWNYPVSIDAGNYNF